MTPGYDEWRIHCINDALLLFGIGTLQIPVNEFPFEIELLKQEFEQEKATFAKEITRLKEENSQLKMDLYLKDGMMNRAIKEKTHLNEDLES